MPVEIVRRRAGAKLARRRIAEIAGTILALVGKADAELSVALIGNAEMRKLNATYRRKDYPTDVLSFPVEGPVGPEACLLGDVIISMEKAAQQAKERGSSLDREVTLLLIHGIVHLLGYDHERSAQDARTMGRVEKEIYRALCERGLIKV
jgi:probable rRNA maturation factor